MLVSTAPRSSFFPSLSASPLRAMMEESKVSLPPAALSTPVVLLQDVLAEIFDTLGESCPPAEARETLETCTLVSRSFRRFALGQFRRHIVLKLGYSTAREDEPVEVELAPRSLALIERLCRQPEKARRVVSLSFELCEYPKDILPAKWSPSAERAFWQLLDVLPKGVAVPLHRLPAQLCHDRRNTLTPLAPKISQLVLRELSAMEMPQLGKLANLRFLAVERYSRDVGPRPLRRPLPSLPLHTLILNFAAGDHVNDLLTSCGPTLKSLTLTLSATSMSPKLSLVPHLTHLRVLLSTSDMMVSERRWQTNDNTHSAWIDPGVVGSTIGQLSLLLRSAALGGGAGRKEMSAFQFTVKPEEREERDIWVRALESGPAAEAVRSFSSRHSREGKGRVSVFDVREAGLGWIA